MTSVNKKTESLPLPIVLILIGVGLYLAYHILVLLAKFFVYIGYNFFVFTDNLLRAGSVSPVFMWGVLGLFTGSIAGVAIAIKKYRLSKGLLLYPIGIMIAFVSIMYLINKPADHNGEISLPGSGTTADSVPQQTPATIYYQVVSPINVRTGPSTSYSKIFILKEGSEVEIIERNLYDSRNVEWLKIKYKDKEGYITAKYLRFSRSQY